MLYTILNSHFIKGNLLPGIKRLCMVIRKAYLDLSIKYKLLIFFYIIILIISVTYGLYSYTISVEQVRERISTANSEVVKQISSNISFLQNDTIDLSSFIAINNGIQTVLQSSYNEEIPLPKQQLQNLNAMEFILSAIVTKDYLSGIILYDTKGHHIYNEFTDGSSGINDLNVSSSIDIYKKINSYDGKPFWFSTDSNSGKLLQNNSNSKICMGRVIKNADTNEKIGYIILFINKATVEYIYKNNLHSNGESFFIIDENNKLVSNTGKPINQNTIKEINELTNSGPQEQSSFNTKIDNDSMLVTYSPITSSGWRIYYSVPMKNMIDQISSIKRFTILMIFFAIIFTFPFILMISTYFTAPIKKLLTSMKKFEKGDFDERVDFKYSDEIGMLGNGYNKMVGNIKELIDTSYKLQIKEKEAELRALQAQINPHFLYNTLNTIYWKAVKTDQYEISEMTLLLSQLFRLTLNMGKDWVTLADEKELIYCYLSLQSIRFKDRLTFTIDIDPSLLKCMTPKLILQPFVENAVIHGIGDRTEGGHISISANLINDKLCFVIHDNGLGMNSEMVKALNSSDFDTNEAQLKQGGYAIRNVVERLKLTFNEEYSLKFMSKLGEGTCIEIEIPIS